ncbi:MAG: hypothetical protein ACI9CF_000172 [Candidatus Omnitrophota bacterium]|jgi:hypothetical protein
MKYGLFCLTLIFMSLYSYTALAATADPTVYKITMKKIEVSTDGSIFITLAENDAVIDIASVSSGIAAAQYVGNVDLPDGTYTNIRATISNSFTLQGAITQDAGVNTGTQFCTDDDGTPTTGGACVSEEQAFTITSDTGFPAGFTLSVGDGTITILDTTNTFTINSDLGPATFRLSFDVSNALVIEADDTVHPDAPSATIANV